MNELELLFRELGAEVDDVPYTELKRADPALSARLTSKGRAVYVLLKRIDKEMEAL